jgi:O-antigen/teichoic acid export membrane protein
LSATFKSGPLFAVLTSLPHALFPIILIFYLSQYGGLGGLADYFIIVSTAGLAQLLVDYGFNIGGVREIEKNSRQSNEKKLPTSQIFLQVALIKLMLAIPLTFCSFLLFAGGWLNVNLFLAVLMGASISIINVSWVYSGLKQISQYNNALSLFKFISFPLIFFLDGGGIVFAAVMNLPIILVFLKSAPLLFDHAAFSSSRIFKQFYRLIIFHLKSNFNLFLNQVFGSGFSIALPVLMNLAMGFEVVAVVGTADRVVKMCLMLYSPVVNLVVSGQISILSMVRYLGFLAVVSFFSALLFYTLPSRVIDSLGVDIISLIRQHAPAYFFILPLNIAHYALFSIALRQQREFYYLLITIIAVACTSVVLFWGGMGVYFLFCYEMVCVFLLAIYIFLDSRQRF